MEYIPNFENAPRILFISRYLAEGSPLLGLQDSHSVHIKGFSLIHFEQVLTSTLPPHDILFFYSRNAVRFFYAQHGINDHAVPVACMGLGTARALAARGIKPIYVGTGEPQTVAKGLLPFVQNKRVLFPRAKHSRLSVQSLLPSSVSCSDVVVYDNRKATNFTHPQADFLMFTSPLNAEAYFDKIPYQKGQIVIAIGQTTASFLRNLGIPKVLIAAQPSEAALAATLIEVLT